MELVFIHGANGSSQVWNYMGSQFTDHNKTFIDYNSFNQFEENLANQVAQLVKKKNIFFITHSMGGIYAYYLRTIFSNQCLGAVTISAPYGGTAISNTMKLVFPFYHHPLWEDTCLQSPLIHRMKSFPVPQNWHQIVCSTKRTFFPLEENDGLITKKSQMALKGINYIHLDDTHYEVVQSTKALEIIKTIVEKTAANKD